VDFTILAGTSADDNWSFLKSLCNETFCIHPVHVLTVNMSTKKFTYTTRQY